MFDLDDLMNNSLGAFLGWCFFCLALRRMLKRK